MTDVPNINERKQDKKEQSKKDDKPDITITDMLLEFSTILKRSPFAVPKEAQRWPHKTMVERDSKEILYVDAVGGVCHKTSSSNLIAEFREWVVSTAPWHIKHWKKATNKLLTDCIEHFVWDADVQIKPQSIRMGMDNEPCWHRICVDMARERVPDGDPRIADFESFLSRCGPNALLLRQWMGSLFFPEADRSQYVWLHGQGKEGKSKIIDMLMAMTGGASHVSMASDTSNERWTHSIVGKRLVLFPDTNSYGFPSSQIFKTCTGGEPVSARRLYHEFYQAELEAKFLFGSNKKPAISGDRCDTRRIIYIEIEPYTGHDDALFKARLVASATWVAVNCVNHYLEHLAANQGVHNILRVTDTTALDELVTLNSMEMQSYLDEFFTLEEQGSPTRLYVLCNHMAKIERLLFKGGKVGVRRWREYLESKGVRCKNFRTEKGVAKCMVGVTLNDTGKRVCERFDEGNMEKTTGGYLPDVTSLLRLDFD